MTKKHDAILRNWHEVKLDGGSYVVGNIYEDSKGRFMDGTPVRTSWVVDLDADNGILETRNTIYKLENKQI